jgi:RimJ/RimL family protein N-acetyltransferase
VLDAITADDAEKYFRLCTDNERNKYWGYDYTETVADPDTDFFYLDQKKDFDNRCAMNLAIRYKGRFAGEVILYDFDFFGTCEIGVRILPEFDRRGIGKEAMNAVAEYAIYTLGIDKVRAKCFKDNLPSKRMLSAIMNKAGEDEQFYYFTKSV